jgi:hypothetical protein
MSPSGNSCVIAFAESAEEREAVCRQRYTVYTEEMHLYQASADHARRVLTDRYDATARLLYARVGNEIVGSLRLHLGRDGEIPDAFKTVYDLPQFAAAVPYADISVCTRFMVSAKHRNTSVAFRLIQANYEFHLQQNLQLGFVACAPHLVNMYLALGFRTYAKNYNDPDVGFVIPMVYVIRDLNHLTRLSSPLLRIASKYLAPSDSPAWVDSVLPPVSAVQSERADTDIYWSQAFGLLTQQSQARHSIFDELSEGQTKLLLAEGHLIECSKGDLIIRKGTIAHGMYVVVLGLVEVRDGDRVLAVLGRNEVLGEIGFLLDSPRSADVYAQSEGVRILSLDERILRRLIEADPAASAKILLNLSRILCLRLLETKAAFGIQGH